ncbi:unnamed protein product [Effrenium voratum]|nr:unnamed protein product [Effrenium voratum]
MLEDVPKATFAEASRLLLAVLGFMCEGPCQPMLRGNVVARGPHLPMWQGITPHVLLREWFDADELLGLFGQSAMRDAFESASRGPQRQFVTLLSRTAFVEAARPGSGRVLRIQWQLIFQQFPEISLVRALLTHVRRRCWEDSRDRSRSRSRSRERKTPKSEADGESVRFFLKNTGDLNEQKLRLHFKHYGQIMSCNVLMDKRKKQFRGMCFVTLKPEGFYKGKRNTKQMMIDWVLEESHVISGIPIEVTQADEKPQEDEEKKRDDRVEERRLARLDKEQRMIRSVGVVAPHLMDRGEKLVPSPWFRRWRHRLEMLPQGPNSWSLPQLQGFCGPLWREVADYANRTGDKTVKEALAFFQDAAGERWSFIPSADLLLTIGDGMVSLTALGVFLAPSYLDPVAPPTINTLVNIAIPTFASANPAPLPQMPVYSFSANPELNRMQKGNFDDCKIFIGGMTLATSLDQMMRGFAAYGKITDAVVMTDKMTGKPRGFGFIVFETPESVAAVLADHDKHHIDGKWVDVKRRNLKVALTSFLRWLSDAIVAWRDPGIHQRNALERILLDLTKGLVSSVTHCHRDPSSMGEVTSKGMMLGLYQVHLEGWPSLEPLELEKLAAILNQAAAKRLRSGGNWYKIFNLVDKAQSGRLSFGGLKEVVRDMWYGLAVSHDLVTDYELKGLWKARSLIPVSGPEVSDRF